MTNFGVPGKKIGIPRASLLNFPLRNFVLSNFVSTKDRTPKLRFNESLACESTYETEPLEMLEIYAGSLQPGKVFKRYVQKPGEIQSTRTDHGIFHHTLQVPLFR